MHSACTRRLAGVALALGCAQAGAVPLSDLRSEFQRARSQNQVTTTVDLDNDALLFQRNDGFYTSGLRLTRQFALDGGADKATGITISYGWRIGQELYTASDIKLPPQQVFPPDHPYAGWLYGGVFREAVHSDGIRERFGIDVGCLGPCALGREAQTTVHRLLGQPLPKGWSRQVRNEIGAVLHADIVPIRWQLGRDASLSPSVHARLGNIYTDGAAALTLTSREFAADAIDSSVQGFARVQARAVAYNASLQGGYFTRHNAHFVSPKRLVGETEIGLRIQHGKIGFSASILRSGNEIADLSNAIGAQNFVRLQLVLTP